MKRILQSVLMLTFALAMSAQDNSTEAAKLAAKANNPLANMKAFNIQQYYQPSLAGSDGNSNATMLRYAQPYAGGRMLLRATVPTFNTSNEQGEQYSGIGGLNVFTTYSFTDPSSPVVFGAGPMVTTSNLTNGQGSINGVEIEDPFADTPWSLGGAIVFFSAKNPRLQYGGLITYEHSVGDVEAGQVKSAAVIQPFMMVQLGGGTYLRSAGSSTLDFENDKYYVPVGLGIGKIAKVGSTIINFYIEPQYTVYSNYAGAPNFQIYTGVNFQFMGGGKS